MTFLGLVLAIAAAHAPQLSAVSSPLNDYNLSMDASERLMVLARSEAEFRNAKIFVAERGRAGWSAPVQIGFSRPDHSDSDPWLTPDGSELYFISDRPAPGRGAERTDYDIWRSRRTAEGWGEPEHLGPEVNSRAQELGPELHRGVLYFSSARRGGAGGLDIYRATRQGSRFDSAELLRGPFNSAASDSDFTMSRDGRKVLFWRSVGERGTIHMSHRRAHGWSEPAPLPAGINAGGFNFTPSFSKDGHSIRYASTLARPGQEEGLADIYEARLSSR